MELSHESHEHSLVFVDGESDTDELFYCLACDGEICGARYSCLDCNFHLHKSCTELPPRLEDHPFHPEHPLSLLPRYPYKGGYCYCDACGQDIYRLNFVYHCSLCGFDLHTVCALSVDLKVSIISGRNGEEELFRYGAYQHLLMLEEEQSTSGLCFVCEESMSAPFFFCSKSRCNFRLHKSCAHLPQQIRINVFHPQHPLFLFPNAQKECQICGRLLTCQYAYFCIPCDFSIHPRCAFSNSADIFRRMRKKRYEKFRAVELPQQILNNYFHPHHPLCLDSEYSGYCNICHRKTDQPTYVCKPCLFFCHPRCALQLNPGDLPLLEPTDELPQQIQNNYFHPQHPLFLDLECSGECKICGQETDQPTYACKPCVFFCHRRCALLNPIDIIKRVGEKQFQHSIHDHSLILLQDMREWRGNAERECGLCHKEVDSFPSYICHVCNFILHKSCAELPSQIKSHLHPDHFLFSLPKPPPGKLYCDSCAEIILGLNYQCIRCGFVLHVHCFLSRQGFEQLYDHKHCFIELKTFHKLSCQTCSEEGHFSPWQCSSCHILVHKQCADLPSILKLVSHHHYLKLTYYLSFVHGYDEMICKLCYRKVNVDSAAYYCSECNYAAHLDCAPKVGDSELEEVNQDDHHASKESQNFVTNSDIKSGVIQHFSHKHELTLIEQDIEDFKYCKGCVTLIFPPFYSCKQCNFYLHKRCGESPRKTKHPFHDHRLTLNVVEDLAWCDECGYSCNGFMYSCQVPDCTFNLDLQCADILPEGLQHPCHEHPLFFPYTREDETCKGCGEKQKHILVCSECDYELGYCCLRIPHVAKHRYDNHLLKLAYVKDDESGEYYCDICEEERDPKVWFYHCSQCEFFAHIDCTLLALPHLKCGMTVKSYSHDHPLTLVEKCQRKAPPLCSSCGKHCYSKVLECCQCNLHFHFNLSCFHSY